MENYFADCMNEEQLRAKYRELCIKMHPDRNADNPDATAEFQEMQAQYEERKAELNGDYSKSRKGRERREREARERDERERKERERRKIEQVVEQARLNRQKSHTEWKPGDYVYARQLNFTRSVSEWERMTVDDLLRVVLEEGVKDECVVRVEYVMELTDKQLLEDVLSGHLVSGMPMGGWEVIQKADPAAGIRKSKRVAKVVMFRSDHYCAFGNPMGDSTISDYYMPFSYAGMYKPHLDRIIARLRHEQQEQARIEAERKAKLSAEQAPVIDEWKDKLIGLSNGLTEKERETVAVANLKTVLKGKFPGTSFKVAYTKFYGYQVQWEDGPTVTEVDDVLELFNNRVVAGGLTPWEERFGHVSVSDVNRKMSVLTKAKILQQLGQVTTAFRECAMGDEVELTDFDWTMLHVMAGVDASDPSARCCISTLHAGGRRTVMAMSAVLYIFQHTNYAKEKKAGSRKKASAR